MQRQSIHFQPNQLSDAALAASRQMWLASLGAAVVTRDWVQNEAGTVLKTLVKEGTAVESRAIRFVGDRLEGSVERANTLWRRTRHTVAVARPGIIKGRSQLWGAATGDPRGQGGGQTV